MPLAEDKIAVSRLHVIRRRFGMFAQRLCRLDRLGMGKAPRDAAARGRRHRFRHGHDAVGAAHVRHLGTAQRLFGPPMWLLGSAEAQDACRLLPAC